MFPTFSFMRETFAYWLGALSAQGHDISGMKERLSELPDSYDAFLALALEAKNLPLRDGWQYVEPHGWPEIENEMDKGRMSEIPETRNQNGYSKKAEAAFLASVLGCILGKPLEVNPSMEELRKAGMACGEWPISDFISEKFLENLGRRHPSWTDTTRGNISYVTADDDLHYTIMGMINLENHGLGLDLDGVKNTWLNHQCVNFTYGSESYIMACVGVSHLCDGWEHKSDSHYLDWVDVLNPVTETCGAAIRADAYGYAFPGRPDLAARLAYTDASFTHRKTGVYSTMFIAAAIALMFDAETPLRAFEGALRFVPQRSRFFNNTKLCLEYVKTSSSFDDAYEKIHHRFIDYGHCGIYQEIGTLINTLHYAEGIWDGVCKQVAQGNDTDSFGCTAGSLLGAFFGYDKLPHEKLALFNDEIRVSLASFHEHSLSSLAGRMGKLSKCVL